MAKDRCGGVQRVINGVARGKLGCDASVSFRGRRLVEIYLVSFVWLPSSCSRQGCSAPKKHNDSSIAGTLLGSFVTQFNWTWARGNSARPHRHIIECPSNIKVGQTRGGVRCGVRRGSSCSRQQVPSRVPARSRPRHPGQVPEGQNSSWIRGLDIASPFSTFQFENTTTNASQHGLLDYHRPGDGSTLAPRRHCAHSP